MKTRVFVLLGTLAVFVVLGIDGDAAGVRAGSLRQYLRDHHRSFRSGGRRCEGYGNVGDQRYDLR